MLQSYSRFLFATAGVIDSAITHNFERQVARVMRVMRVMRVSIPLVPGNGGSLYKNGYGRGKKLGDEFINAKENDIGKMYAESTAAVFR